MTRVPRKRLGTRLGAAEDVAAAGGRCCERAGGTTGRDALRGAVGDELFRRCFACKRVSDSQSSATPGLDRHCPHRLCPLSRTPRISRLSSPAPRCLCGNEGRTWAACRGQGQARVLHAYTGHAGSVAASHRNRQRPLLADSRADACSSSISWLALRFHRPRFPRCRAHDPDAHLWRPSRGLGLLADRFGVFERGGLGVDPGFRSVAGR